MFQQLHTPMDLLNRTIELSNDMDALHISQMEFEDGWDESSFGDDSLSKEEFEKELERLRRRRTCDCIDDALALLSSPVNERRSKKVSSSAPPTLPLPTFSFDLPPTHPRRSFDFVSKHSVLRSQSDLSHDRFQLSKSEHISLSLLAPKCPSRPSDSVNNANVPPRRRTRPSLHVAESSRDVSIQPPSRTHSGDVDSTIPHTKQSLGSDSPITLKAAGRVLLGSRELSTSEHLRRSCPTGRTILGN